MEVCSNSNKARSTGWLGSLIEFRSPHKSLGHLTNDFYRSYRNDEEEETILHLLGKCPALSLGKNKNLGVNIEDLSELSCADVGSQNLFT